MSAHLVRSRKKARQRSTRVPLGAGAALHAVFLRLLTDAGLPAPRTEFQFAKEAMRRKWAMDYCWPDHKVGLECDGGVWNGGRHTRGSGWMKDTEKLNAAATLGFRMLRCTPDQLCTPDMLATIRNALSPSETP